MKARLRPRTSPFLIVAMAVFSFLCVYPFYYVLILSLNDSIDATRGGIYLWPRILSFASYGIVFENKYLVNAFLLSAARVIVMVVLVPLTCSLYGYAVSYKKLIARGFFSGLLIIPMYIGGGLIPFYFVLRALNLFDTFFVFIIPYMFSSFNVLLFRSHFQELSPSLRESAIVDGASEARIFFRIVFPISVPVFTAVALFAAVGNWNEWMVGQLFVANSKLYPLATILLQILRSQSLNMIGMSVQQNLVDLSMRKVTPESVRLAMIVIATVPILMIYPLLQKHFIHGIMIGSVKE